MGKHVSRDFSLRCVSGGYLRCFWVPNFNAVPNLRDMTVIQWQNMSYTGLWLPFSQCVIVILRTSSDKHGGKNTWIRISIQIDQSVWVKTGYINIKMRDKQNSPGKINLLLPDVCVCVCKSKSKSKKTLFNVGQCKQYNISSHSNWNEC